jgi:STE24 endopeptidase
MVTGHEMGHYVLNHIVKSILVMAGVILAGFLILRWLVAYVTVHWPASGIKGISDPASMPLLLLFFLVFSFMLAPGLNTWSRTIEAEADHFGLEATQLPDAAATTFLVLGEYRDIDPNSVIEFLFFDHPSGRNRIHSAMEWKQAHKGLVKGDP